MCRGAACSRGMYVCMYVCMYICKYVCVCVPVCLASSLGRVAVTTSETAASARLTVSGDEVQQLGGFLRVCTYGGETKRHANDMTWHPAKSFPDESDLHVQASCSKPQTRLHRFSLPRSRSWTGRLSGANKAKGGNDDPVATMSVASDAFSETAKHSRQEIVREVDDCLSERTIHGLSTSLCVKNVKRLKADQEQMKPFTKKRAWPGRTLPSAMVGRTLRRNISEPDLQRLADDIWRMEEDSSSSNSEKDDQQTSTRSRKAREKVDSSNDGLPHDLRLSIQTLLEEICKLEDASSEEPDFDRQETRLQGLLSCAGVG